MQRKRRLTIELPKPPSPERHYCPGCKPNADPLIEALEVKWCIRHEPSVRGTDDSQVTVPPLLPGTTDRAGGETNRRFCNFIHRGSGRKDNGR